MKVVITILLIAGLFANVFCNDLIKLYLRGDDVPNYKPNPNYNPQKEILGAAGYQKLKDELAECTTKAKGDPVSNFESYMDEIQRCRNKVAAIYGVGFPDVEIDKSTGIQ